MTPADSDRSGHDPFPPHSVQGGHPAPDHVLSAEAGK
jgi:hypothetical protein